MAFNANTYKANQSAKSAYDTLSKARDIKARAAVGDAYDWEIERISTLVAQARFHMRSALHHRAMKDLTN